MLTADGEMSLQTIFPPHAPAKLTKVGRRPFLDQKLPSIDHSPLIQLPTALGLKQTETLN